jgi:predicted SprT family Zn-dependent metalloprotease
MPKHTQSSKFKEFKELLTKQVSDVKRFFDKAKMKHDHTTFLEDCDICHQQDVQVVAKPNGKYYCKNCY